MTEALLRDSLTRLPNLIAVADELRELPETAGALVLMDLTALKDLNERHGMEVGDRVIRLFGDLLGELCTRPGQQGQAYRIGGDEFMLHLTGSCAAEVEPTLAQLSVDYRERLAAQRLPQVGFRHAVVHYPADGETLAILISKLNRRLPESGLPTTRSPSRWVESQLGWFIQRLAESVDALRVTHVLAMTDSISELPNHRAADRRISELIAAHNVSGAGFAVLFVDGDNLKPYNEHLGYDAGNQMIRMLGQTLADYLRDGDFVCRWLSGDEFLVMLPGVNAAAALQVGERLRAAVQEAFVSRRMPVTVSVGISVCPDHGLTATSLVNAATEASARAKRLGKNRCVIWEPTDP